MFRGIFYNSILYTIQCIVTIYSYNLIFELRFTRKIIFTLYLHYIYFKFTLYLLYIYFIFTLYLLYIYFIFTL